MKTVTIKQEKLCEKQSLLLRWQPLQELRLSSIKRRLKNAHVFRAVLAGLSVIGEVTGNSRYCAGLVLLFVVSPLVGISYNLFDKTPDYSWFYHSAYYFIYILSPYLMLLVASVGVFLLFPTEGKNAYIVSVPLAGYALSKIIFYSFFVDSNETFYMPVHWVVFVSGFCLVIGFLLSVNHLIFLYNHRKRSIQARWKGIIQLPGVSADEKVKLLENQFADLMDYNTKY